MTHLPDRQVREAAVKARTNVVVTAGAGTGKTTLLVDAVLARLLDDGIDVRRILMLTFTEKAANEMRIRLRETLERREPTERVRAALGGLDQTHINTIHGFCAHLLREFAVEAGVDPAFTVDEGQHFRATFQREWERWLEIELATDAPRKDIWLNILERANLDRLREVAEGLCSFHLPESALDAARAQAWGRRALEQARREVTAELERCSKPCGRPLNNLLRQMQDTARYLNEGGDASFLETAQSGDQRGWLPEDYQAASNALAQARALARDIARMDEARVGETTSILCEFARRFRAAYTAAGFVSFDGLLLHAYDLLTSDTFPSIRTRVRERFDLILVDEVQDTDPVQCEIVTKLAEDESGRLAPGRLFVVGDPKQSIYSFRGADIVACRRLQQRMLQEDGTLHVLETNFRSHAGILDVVNALFAHIIRERQELQPPYEPIVPAPDRARPEGPTVEMALFEKKEGRITNEESRRAEAEYAARWIGEHVTRYRDVAILLKALTDAHVYLEALREHGIPYVVEGEKFFYGVPEVIDFVNLLSAIADPNDAVALVGLLRSPLGAVEDRTLFELKQAGALDYRATPAEPRLARLYAQLRRLHERAKEAGVVELIDEIFESTFVLELAAAGYTGEQAVANLHKIRQKARQLDARSLGPFLRTLREAIRTMEEEGESPLADETLDAVRVLSIHKAKGLEFPVVILPDLHREAAGRHPEPPVRYDWPMRTLGVRLAGQPDAGAAALAYREAQRRLEEDKRIPYVALTRPRERLLMLGSGRFSSASLLGMIAQAVSAAGGPSIESFEGTVGMGPASFELRREVWREPERRPKPEVAARPVSEDWASFAAVWRRREADYERAPAGATLAPQEEDLDAVCRRALERMDLRRPRVDVAHPEAREILEAFVKTPAFAQLGRAKVLARALPFIEKREGRLRATTIDLVCEMDRALWVVGYSADVEEHPERHAEWKGACLDAVARLLKRAPAGFKLVYVRTGRVVGME